MDYSNHSLHVRKHGNWKHIARAHLNGHYQRHNAKNKNETTNHTKRKEKRAEVSELKFPCPILFYCVAGRKAD